MSALDELVKKDIRKYTPVEHAIFRVWMEGLESESPVIIDMAKQSADEIAAKDAELSALRAEVEKYKKFFDEVEWCGDPNAHVCPDCGNKKSQGHRPSCRYRVFRGE